MKKTLLIIGTLILLFITIQLIRMYYSGNTIPNYNYLGLDNKYHTNKELPKTPIIFVYFSPDCGFCEKAIVELKRLNQKNKTVNCVFITTQKSKKIIADFTKLNKLTELTKSIFIDEKDSFPMDFGLGMTYTIPTILAYNQKGEFVKEISNYEDIKFLEFFKN